MAKKGKSVKGARAMKGGKLSSSMSKATKKALKHMPKRERAMVLSTLNSSGSAAWSQKRIADRKGGSGSSEVGPAKSNRPAAPQQSAFAMFSKSGQRILVVGDGNFSFTASLVSLYNGDGTNITATSYDSKEVLHEKYSDAKTHIKTLKNSGAKVHFEVDGTRLGAFQGLDPPYDLIIFNFPHVGLGIKDQAQNILVNQQLVSGFVQSARTYVHSAGAVCVTVKKGEPYDSWKVARLGLAVPGLRLKTAVEFQASSFPLFVHRRTAGERSDASEEDNGLLSGGAKTFVFTADKEEKGEGKDKAKAKGTGAGKKSAKRNRKQ